VLPQLEMLPKKNAPHHLQVFSMKGNSYRLRERMAAATTASSPRQNR
jgi:hypothetical protein